MIQIVYTTLEHANKSNYKSGIGMKKSILFTKTKTITMEMLDWMHLDEINLQCSSAKPDPGSDNHGN
jgi:hypothetical protein